MQTNTSKIMFDRSFQVRWLYALVTPGNYPVTTHGSCNARTPADKKGKEVQGCQAKVDHVLLGNGTPRDARLGDDADMKIKIAPESKCQLIRLIFF